jgi:hypothetical protein
VLILIVLFLATIVLAFIPGVGIIAIVPAFILAAYIVWLVFAFATGKTPQRAVSQTPPGPNLESGGPSGLDRDAPPERTPEG